MRTDLELWKFISDRIERDRPVVLFVVAESSGSSPGRAGFKMAVAEEGMCGSIGGGVMEVRLTERAREILLGVAQGAGGPSDPASTGGGREGETRSPVCEMFRQVHRANSNDPSGMICSGEQTVIRALLEAGDLKAVRRIARAFDEEESVLLTISNSGIRCDQDGSGDRGIRFESSSDAGFLYEETIQRKNRLFVVGGGHCALALSEAMSKLEFHISLFDDRPELNTFEKNIFADEKQIIDSYEEIGDLIPSGHDVYVVVMTIGYKFDELVIRKLLEKDFRYFGVLGSEAKMSALLRGLREDGFDRERIARIRTPIGLKINSRTPDEIAVSIAAEIIADRNAKS